MVPLMGARALLAAPGCRGAAVLEKEQAFLLQLGWIWEDYVRPEVCLTQEKLKMVWRARIVRAV
jgi:hypothetical protein